MKLNNITLALALLSLTQLSTNNAYAACTPASPTNGQTVTCTGTDETDGVISTATDLIIDINPASEVRNSGGHVIDLNTVSGTTVINVNGDIITTTANGISTEGSNSLSKFEINIGSTGNISGGGGGGQPNEAIDGSNAEETVTIEGSVTGPIRLDGGNDEVILNGGTINDDIEMGNGSDIVRLNSGTFNGDIDLSAGDDFLFINALGFTTLPTTQIDGGVNSTNGVDTLEIFGDSFTFDNTANNFEKFVFNPGAGNTATIGAGTYNADEFELSSGTLDMTNPASQLEGALLITNTAEQLDNGGTLFNAIGNSILVDVDGFVINNVAGGEIAANNGVAIDVANDASVTIVNDGIIRGTTNSIRSTDGDIHLTVTNGGVVRGDIALDGGDNTVILENGGSIEDDIQLGEGTNTLDIDDTFTGNTTFGNGDDVLIIREDGDLASLTEIDLGNGDNTLTVEGDLNADVTMGTGDDQVNIFLDTATIGAGVDIDSGSGTDEINYVSTGTNTIDLASVIEFEQLGLDGGGAYTLINDDDTALEDINLTNTSLVTIASSAIIDADINGSANADTITSEGTVNGDIMLGAGSDTLNYNDGDITGTIDFGADDDNFNVNLDNVSISGGIDGGAGTNDVATLTSSTDETISGSINGFEDLTLVGDQEFTFAGNVTADDITLDTATDLTINSGTTTTATNVLGDSGVNILTVDGNLNADVDLGADDDVFNIDLDTGSYTGTADGGLGANDILRADASAGNATFTPTNTIRFETLDLTGDNEITVAGTNTFEDVTLDADTDLEIASGSSLTVTNDITGDTGSNDITIGGTINGNIDQAAGDDKLTIDLDTASFTGTADGGAGTDTVEYASTSNQTLSSTLSNYEALELSGNSEFTLDMSTSFDTITLDDATDVIIDSAEVVSTTSGLVGDTGNNKVTVEGTLNSSVALGLGDDEMVINLDTGAFTNTADGGAGGNDTLTYNASTAQTLIGATGTNFETLDLTGDSEYTLGGTFAYDDITLDGDTDAVLDNSFSSTADITGDTGVNDITLEGTYSGNIDQDAGNDTLTIDLDQANFTGNADGGAGTDTVEYTSSTDQTISSTLSNYENTTLSGDVTYSTGADITTDTLTLTNATDLTINNGNTVTATDLNGDSDINIVTVNGDLNANVDLGAANDEFILDLDTGSYTGSNDGGAGTDIARINSDNADATVTPTNFTNYETLDLTGDNKITVGGANTFDDITLDGNTDLEVAAGSSLTANNAITGDTGENDITIAGTVSGAIDQGAGDDTLTINLDTGSYTGAADGGAGTDTIEYTSAADQTITSTFANYESLGVAGDSEFTLDMTSSFTDISIDDNTDLVIASGADITATSGVTADGGDNTLTIEGALSGDVDLGSGDDIAIIDLDTATYSDNLDGQGGDDTITYQATSAQNIDGDKVDNFETMNLDGDTIFTLQNSFDEDDINLTNEADVTTNATTNITADITGDNGVNDLVINGGTISGDINLGDDDDTIAYNNGTLSGAIDMGAGDDTFTANLDNVTLPSNISGGAGTNDDLTLTASSNQVLMSQVTDFENMTLAGDVLYTTGDDITVDNLTLDTDTDFTIAANDTVTVTNLNGDTGANDLTVNGDLSATLTDLLGGDDTLTIDLDTATVSGNFEGGAGGNDTLTIDNSSDHTLTATQYTEFEELNLSGGSEVTYSGNDDAELTDINLVNDTDLNVANGSVIDANITGDTSSEDITIAGTVNGDIDQGSGNDQLTIDLDTAVLAGSADGGAGTDTVEYTSTSDQTLTSTLANYENLNLAGDIEYTTGADITADDITMVQDTDLTISAGDTVTANNILMGDSGVNELTVDGTLAGDFDLKQGDDIFNINLDTATFADNADGGAGTDIANYTATSAQTLDGDLIDNFETLNLNGDDTYTLTNSFTEDDINLVADTNAIVDTTANISSNITGDSGVNDITLNGTMSGDIAQNSGDDTLTIDLDTANFTGSADGGAGTDTLGFNSSSDVTTNLSASDFTSYENVNLDGDVLYTVQGTNSTIDTLTLVGATDAVIDDNANITLATGLNGDSGINELTINGTLGGDIDLLAADDILNINYDNATFTDTAKGGAGDNDILNIDSSSDMNIDQADFTEFEEINLSGASEFTLTGDDDAELANLNLLSDTSLVVDATGTVDADITGTTGEENVTIAGTVNGDIDQGAGDDRLLIDVDTGGTLTGLADGGAGTDTVGISSAGVQTVTAGAAGFTNYEGIAVGGGGDFTITGTDPTVEAITISDAGTDVLLDNTTDFTADVTGDTDVQTLELDGKLTGTVDLRQGDDIFTLDYVDGADFTGTADGGADNDTLVVKNNADRTINTDDYVRFETLDLDGDAEFTLTGNDPDFDTANLVNDADLVIANGADITLDVNGNDATEDTLTVLGTLTGDVALGDMDDEMKLDLNTGAFTGSADGGAGIDTFTVISATDNTINASVANFENLGLEGDATFTTGADINVDQIIQDGDTNFVIDDTVTATIVGDTGSNDLTVNMDTGLLIGTADGGAGTDVLTFNSAADQTLNTNDYTNYETLNLVGDQTYTVETATFDDILLDNNTDLLVDSFETLTGDVTAAGGDNIITVGGTITGNVDQGAGNDILAFDLDSSGTVTGLSDGGAGSDTIRYISTSTETIDVSPTAVTSYENLDLQGNVDYTLDGTNTFDDITTDVSTDLTIATGSNLTANNNITAGTGDTDFIVDAGATVTADEIDLQEGVNNATINGVVNSDIIGGANRDIFTLAPGSAVTGNLDFEGDDDVLNLADPAAFTGVADGGAGTDTLDVTSASPVTIDTDNFPNFETMDLDGATTFTVAGTDPNFDTANLLNDADMIIAPTAITTLDILGDATDNILTIDGANNGDIDLGDGQNEIIVNGSLNGDIDTGTGDDILTIPNGIYSGDADLSTGDNTINLGGNLIGTIVTGDDDDILNSTGGVVSGTIDLAGGDNGINGPITNAGEIISDTPLDINGNYTQAPTGQLTFEVQSDDPNSTGVTGVTNPLTITGDADLAGTFVVNNQAGDDPVNFILGETYDILTATGTITDNGLSFVLPTITDPTLGFQTNITGNLVQLEVISQLLGCGGSNLPANTQAICDAINAQIASGNATGAQTAAINDLNGHVNTTGNFAAMDAAGAEGYFAALGGLTSSASAFNKLFHDRQVNLRHVEIYEREVYGNPSNKKDDETDCGAYGHAYGNKFSMSNDPDNGWKGYESTTAGLAGGVDCYTEDYMFGGALGLSQTSTESELPLENDALNVHAAAYGALWHDSWHLGGMLSYTHAMNEATREVTTGSTSTATSEFNGSAISAKIEGGFDYTSTAYNVRPFVAAEYQMLSTEDITETGAGALDISVDGFDTDRMFATAGVRLEADIISTDDTIFVPYFEGAYINEISEMDRNISATILDQNVTMQGIDTPEHRWNLGVGFNSNLFGDDGINNHQFYGGYDYELGMDDNESENHHVRAGYRYNF